MTENNLVTALNDKVGKQINNELGALKTVRHSFSPKFNKRMSRLVKSADSKGSLFLWRHSRIVISAVSAAAVLLVFAGGYAVFRRLMPIGQNSEYGYDIITDEKHDLSPITKGTRKYSFVQYGYSEDTMLPFADNSGIDLTYDAVEIDKKDVYSKVRELCGMAPDDKAASAENPYDNWLLYTYYYKGSLLYYHLFPDNDPFGVSIIVYPDDASYVLDFGDIPGSELSDNRTIYYKYTQYVPADASADNKLVLLNDRESNYRIGYDEYDFVFAYRGEHPVTVIMNITSELSANRQRLVDIIDSIFQ